MLVSLHFCGNFFLVQKREVPIKLNTAAILREGKLYKERQDQEIKRFVSTHELSHYGIVVINMERLDNKSSYSNLSGFDQYSRIVYSSLDVFKPGLNLILSDEGPIEQVYLMSHFMNTVIIILYGMLG